MRIILFCSSIILTWLGILSLITGLNNFEQSGFWLPIIVGFIFILLGITLVFLVFKLNLKNKNNNFIY